MGLELTNVHMLLFQVGEVVYARVSRAHRDMEAELSCIDGSGKASGLGPLPVAGYLIQRCSIGLARKWVTREMKLWLCGR